MSLPRPSGLKTPAGSKLARPSTGVPQKSGLMQPGSIARTQSAIAKSARAAGLSSTVADKYAADLVHAQRGEEELSAPPPPLDDFIIGDRVFVSGSKPGYIAFLGETQFAPGEWAGVVLDETIGKNDGSVSGVKYFQCEPRRGVFCRISKLSRTPSITPGLKSEDGLSEVSIPVNGTPASKRPTTPSGIQRPTTPSHYGSGIARPTTPSLPKPVNKSLSSSSTSLNKGAAPSKVKSESQTAGMGSGVKHNLRLGDRVLVSGSKPGTLRYLGPADFAKGEWAGVELDDPLGKNDGAVAGKRYFECQPRYGLFAPVHKVNKMSGGTTPSPMTRSLGSTSMRLSREKSGSQESVSSMSSATSSASRPRVRLGVSGLGNNQPTPGKGGQRPSTLNITATTTALQKALKEKEEHIEQLLRERDLERSDVARAAAQVDEAQEQLSNLKVEKDRYQEEADDNIQQLRSHVHKLQEDKRDLELKLDDEKRKVEDLQFQIEEEVISKDDLESRTEEEEAKIKDLERSLKKEKEKAEKYEKEVTALSSKLGRHEEQHKSMEETLTTYLDQVEELTHKLSQAENKINSQDSNRLEEGAKTSQIGLELSEKSARVGELEDFLSLKEKEVKQLQEKLTEMKDDVESRNSKQDRLQQQLTELSERLKANEAHSNDLSTQLQNLKLENGDLRCQLTSSQEKNSQILEEKNQLASQVAEMVQNSGDSSNQLQMLNEQLSQKTRKLEEVQADLLTSTQKWHNLNNTLETSMRDKEREIETLNNKHKEEENKLVGDFEDVQRELEKTKSKMVTMETDFTSEKETLTSRKDGEIGELKQQLEAVKEDLSKQEIQTQAHKQVLDNATMEKEAIQFEKEKIEKTVKRLEGERDSLNNELIQIKVSMSKSQVDVDEAAKQKAELEEKINDLQEEKEKVEKAHLEIQKQKGDVQADKEKVCSERDLFKRELMEIRASLQHKDMQVEEYQKDVERLKSENSQQQEAISQLSQQGSESTVLQEQLSEQRALVESLQKQLSASVAEVTEMKDGSKQAEEETRSLKIELEETQETVTLLEENVKDLETERDGLKKKVKQLSSSDDAVKALEVERDSLRSQLETSLEARQEQGKLMELNKTLNSEIEALHQRHRKEVETLQSVKDSLQQELDNSGALIEQKEKEIKAKLTQITNLENENSTLLTYKSDKERLESETSELQDKVNKLTSTLSESETKSNVINNLESTNNNTDANSELVEKLKEECESTQHQVEFLNSVIVDLQHKNEELKARLEAMETAVVQNGDDTFEEEPAKRRLPPRVFCDICDVFDLHDTEDCPQQEMSDYPEPTKYHGDRNQVRPYCDICEEFHEPCSALSIKKVEASAAAKPIDPKDLVHNWVKTMDTVTSELQHESKIFGDDQEFFHVQRDPSDVPGFRDSGYYDGILDSKLAPDMKPGLTALSESMNATLQGKKTMLEGLSTVQDEPDGEKDDKTKIKYAVVGPNETEQPQQKFVKEGSKERPAKLPTKVNTDMSESYNNDETTTTTVESPGHSSSSDGEFHSGREELSLNLDSAQTSDTLPPTPITGVMESSVDMGVASQSEGQGEEVPDGDKTAENCVVS